jgi:hypothetical protein
MVGGPSEGEATIPRRRRQRPYSGCLPSNRSLRFRIVGFLESQGAALLLPRLRSLASGLQIRALAEQVTGEVIRIGDEWERHPADRFGCTFAFTIWVPSEDVIDVPNDAQEGTNVIWLLQPAPGSVTAIRIVLVGANRAQVELPEDIRPVAAFTLVNQTFLLVMANAFEPDETARGQLQALRSACRALSAEKGGDTASGAVRWTVRAEENESRRRRIYDFAHALVPGRVAPATSA